MAMSYVESGRVFDAFKFFCESVWIDWANGNLGTDEANYEIDQKRRELEDRWSVELQPYVIAYE